MQLAPTIVNVTNHLSRQGGREESVHERWWWWWGGVGASDAPSNSHIYTIS